MFPARTLAIEILVALRGRRTPSGASRKAGFAYNRVNRWETGKQRPDWNEFCVYAQKLGAPLGRGLQAVFPAWDSGAPHGESAKELIALALEKNFSGDTRAASRAAGCSAHTWRRWQSGKTQPSFEEMVALLDGGRHSVLEFANELVDIRKVPSLASLAEIKRLQFDLVRNNPLLVSASYYLDLTEYQRFKNHPNGWLAEKLGIPTREEPRLLAQLCACALIELKDGKYRRIKTWVYISDAEIVKRQSLLYSKLAHGFFNAAERRAPTPVDSRMTWVIARVSEKEFAEFKKMLNRFIATGLKLDEQPAVPGNEKTRIVQVNLQLIDLAELTRSFRGIPTE